MSLLVFVEDTFAPEVTALTLKTSNFFLNLSFNGISYLVCIKVIEPSVASVTRLFRNIFCKV